MNSFLTQPFWGAHISNYVWFAGIIIAAFLFKKLFSRGIAWITSRFAMKATAGKHSRLFITLLRQPLEWLFAIVLFFIAFNFIEAPLNNVTVFHYHSKDTLRELRLSEVIDQLFLLSLIIFTALTLSRLVDFFYHSSIESAMAAEYKHRAQILPLLKEVVKLILWTVAFFWILGSVFHVNIPALVTGLGIGGVAFALAAKESVENLFASFTILLDKPFEADDTIRLGTLEGKVERIGFRSTRLRGSDGSRYIIPNKKLVDENLENLSQRDTRSIKVNIALKYGLPPDKLQALIDELKHTVEKILHVVAPIDASLDSFGENAFGIVLSYHLPQTLKEDDLPAIRQEINLKAFTILAKYTSPAQAAANISANATGDAKPDLNTHEEPLSRSSE